MADTALSALPAATTIDADDLFYVVQDGVSVKATTTQVGTAIAALGLAGGDAQTADSLAQFAATTSAELRGVLSDETGTGSAVFGTSPTLITPALGTPSALVLTNATGLPLTSGVTGVLPIANFTTGSPTGSKFVRDDGVLAVPAGTGGTVSSVAATVPSFLSISGSPVTSSGTLAITYSGTALPVANGGTGITAFGTGVATALGVNTGSAGAFVTFNGALGTPSALVLTNATGLPTAGLANNAVTNAKAAQMANGTIKGRQTSGTGDPEDLTYNQQRILLNKAQTLTSGTTVTPDADSGLNMRLVLAHNMTLANPTNLVNGDVINLRIKQDGTGSRLLSAVGSKWKFPGGTLPVLSTAASAVDFISGSYDSTDDTIAAVCSKAFA